MHYALYKQFPNGGSQMYLPFYLISVTLQIVNPNNKDIRDIPGLAPPAPARKLLYFRDEHLQQFGFPCATAMFQSARVDFGLLLPHSVSRQFDLFLFEMCISGVFILLVQITCELFLIGLVFPRV